MRAPVDIHTGEPLNYLNYFFEEESVTSRIKVVNLVEMDGDEMTRIIWQFIIQAHISLY
jgi:isocitrate dehydrogenase